MIPKHIIDEAVTYVETLSGEPRRFAEVRSMSVFAIAKMFGFLPDFPQTYAELSDEERCAMAYFEACLQVPTSDRAELLRTNTLLNAIEDGGYDLSVCMICNTPVVCIPDGLPICKKCVEAEN